MSVRISWPCLTAFKAFFGYRKLYMNRAKHSLWHKNYKQKKMSVYFNDVCNFFHYHNLIKEEHVKANISLTYMYWHWLFGIKNPPMCLWRKSFCGYCGVQVTCNLWGQGCEGQKKKTFHGMQRCIKDITDDLHM